jgi:hypothetical protein
MSLGLARLLALQADPVGCGSVACAEYSRHHRHAAGGADRRTLVIHAGSMAARLVRPTARAHHELDIEDSATGAEFLSTYELGERLHGLDSELPSRNRDHRQRRLDERGGRRIRVAGDRQICGDVDPPRLRFVSHPQGEGLPGSEDGGGRVGQLEEALKSGAAGIDGELVHLGDETAVCFPDSLDVPLVDVPHIRPRQRSGHDPDPLVASINAYESCGARYPLRSQVATVPVTASTVGDSSGASGS